MTRATLPVCVLCSLMSSQAQAQETPLVLLSSGAHLPTSDYGDFHGVGPSFGAALDVPITPRLAVQGAVGYYSLPVRAQRGRASGLFGMGNLKVLLPEASAATPYLMGGLGVWRTGFSDLWLSTDGVSRRPRREGEEESRFAVNFGAGATVPLGERVGLFGQARYVMVWTDDPKIRMIPIELGVTYSRR